MKHQEVIRRLCSLVSNVGLKRFAEKKAHDCFCSCISNVEVDEEIIEFIEKAVNDKIDS